jgi:hypothetical protein
MTETEERELSEYVYLPDVHTLAEQLRSCLQESEPLPSDFTQLFDDTLFKFDTNLIPEAVALYEVRLGRPMIDAYAGLGARAHRTQWVLLYPAQAAQP